MSQPDGLSDLRRRREQSSRRPAPPPPRHPARPVEPAGLDRPGETEPTRQDTDTQPVVTADPPAAPDTDGATTGESQPGSDAGPPSAADLAVRPVTRPPTAAPGRATARRGTPAVAAQAGQAEALWELVIAAGEDARANSTEWEKYSPNIPEGLWDAIGRRRTADIRATRRKGLSDNHYMQVALMRMPRRDDGSIDAAAVIAVARQWLGDNPGILTSKRVPSGSNLRADLAGDLYLLSSEVSRARPKIYLWVVISAYVEQFLAALPPRPGL